MRAGSSSGAAWTSDTPTPSATIAPHSDGRARAWGAGASTNGMAHVGGVSSKGLRTGLLSDGLRVRLQPDVPTCWDNAADRAIRAIAWVRPHIRVGWNHRGGRVRAHISGDFARREGGMLLGLHGRDGEARYRVAVVAQAGRPALPPSQTPGARWVKPDFASWKQQTAPANTTEQNTGPSAPLLQDAHAAPSAYDDDCPRGRPTGLE